MALRKVTKKKVKLRIGIESPSGFGKTMSALLMAFGICGKWDKIALIDSEYRSGDLYAHLGDYNVFSLDPPFTPESYINAIKECENADMEVIIIDSITHEWAGAGGCLDIQTQLGGRYLDWGKVTPRHNAFVNSILGSKCHIITCVRKKQDYEMTVLAGKSTVVKVGMASVTREGFEYELTINFDIINDQHLVKTSKDRTNLFINKPEFIITIDTGRELINWANEGVDPIKYLIDSLKLVTNRTELNTLWKNNVEYHENNEVLEILKEMSIKFPK